MELPTLPAERGHAKGVRQRVERCFPAIRAAVGFLEVSKEALDRKFGDRAQQLAGRGRVAGEDGHERYISVPDFLLHIGLDMERKRDAMVRADLALAERRRIRRRACDRRDRLSRKLYKARVKFKKEALAKLGKKRWKNAVMIKGETPRDPNELARRAGLDLSWASGRLPPRLGLDQYPVDWKAMTAPLKPLRDDLEEAIDAVYHESAIVAGALEDRIRTMADFDEWYAKGSRMLECTYILLGLPTLASAVRPYLKVSGRVGRPSNTRPADDYPDLIERVRADGLLPATAERPGPPVESDETSRLAVWIAAYREVIVPYLSFLTGLKAAENQSTSSGSAASPKSAAAWPARMLARWRGRGNGG